MGFYDGVRAFKGYMNRMHGWYHPYDWADLSEDEKKRFAQRESESRERRKKTRFPGRNRIS